MQYSRYVSLRMIRVLFTWSLLKGILRYLKGTLTHVFTFGRRPPYPLRRTLTPIGPAARIRGVPLRTFVFF